MASIVTPQFVHARAEKPMTPDTALVRVALRVVPEITYTSVFCAVQTVWPVREFEAHAFTTFGVAICCGVRLLPSTFTTAIFVAPLPPFPLGTYETTFVPVTSTDNELEGWYDKALKGLVSVRTACGLVTVCWLKVAVPNEPRLGSLAAAAARVTVVSVS